jgi:hypothetical protein
VAQRKVTTVLAELVRNLKDSRRLAADAYLWSSTGAGGARPLISAKRRESMTELAFLRAFLAWEAFLEEAFILYLSGQRPPRGRAPHRFAFPPNRRAALDWVAEGREYAQWTHAIQVSGKAERFFRDGRPFSQVLRGNQNSLDEARIIRNSIAHQSRSTREKFETMARRKLTILPPNLTVGAFLSAAAPGNTPPISFLEFYVGKIEFAAQQIVPS